MSSFDQLSQKILDRGFVDGDVLEYENRAGEDRRDANWCREGQAIVMSRTDGTLVALDTFWSGGSETHVLNDAELSTAELLFNVSEYDELDRHGRESPNRWEEYSPSDRQVITSQHGLVRRYFIRRGSQPDWATKVENARRKVEAKESELRSANYALEWAREELKSLLEEVTS